MRKAHIGVFGAVACGWVACSCERGAESASPIGEQAKEEGLAEVALTNTPKDVLCVEIAAESEARSVSRRFLLAEGQKMVFGLSGLPIGKLAFSAEAFDTSCANVGAAEASWISQPVSHKLRAGIVTHVALPMVSNGRTNASVDSDDSNSLPGDPTARGCSGTKSSNPQPYLVPVAPGVVTHAILTTGDSPNKKPDGSTPYRFVGIPGGTGAFDNGDGTFTWLVNHEIPQTAGIARAHGGTGAFVSKHIVCKENLEVVHSSDLIREVVLWTPGAGYGAPTRGEAFSRFCSADLADESAYYDAASGIGYKGRIFMNGEELGSGGRAFGHLMDGTTYELPRLGKFSWEQSIGNPKPGLTTVVAGTDDDRGGQVYLYYGTKTNTGSPVDMSGLTNGNLYALRVIGIPEEPSGGIAGPMPVDLFNHGNVEDWTGAELDDNDVGNGVTGFNRPGDAVWDPNNPNHMYFVTTASFNKSTRLWVVRFKDVHDPLAGGEIEMLVDGINEGGHMFDNMTMDRHGHVYLQEDPGGNVYNAKIWRYNVATDGLTLVAEHYPPYFIPGVDSASFLTTNEEASGIFDASHILGFGWFLVVDQAHYGILGELFGGGQLLAMYDPAAVGL